MENMRRLTLKEIADQIDIVAPHDIVKYLKAFEDQNGIVAAHDIVKRCIIRGNFTLRSGESSTWLCDLLKDIKEFPLLARTLRPDGWPIGIEFGGVLLAAALGEPYGIVRKDGKVYLPATTMTAYLCLIDDVCTTGDSFKAAESALRDMGFFVIADRVCVLDRRDPAERKRYPIRSLVIWEDVMESRL